MLHSQIRHPHVLQFFGACSNPPNLCLVTELMNTSLHDALKVAAPTTVFSTPILCTRLHSPFFKISERFFYVSSAWSLKFSPSSGNWDCCRCRPGTEPLALSQHNAQRFESSQVYLPLSYIFLCLILRCPTKCALGPAFQSETSWLWFS